MTFRPWKTSIT